MLKDTWLFIYEFIHCWGYNNYENDSDYGWRSIKPSTHAPVVIPLSLSDSAMDSASITAKVLSDSSFESFFISYSFETIRSPLRFSILLYTYLH